MEIRRLNEAERKFSEVYGMNRSEIIAMVGEDNAKRLTMRFIRKYPAIMQYIRLRKQRSLHMIEAMKHGVFERGNLKVRVDGRHFIFSYRGTDILSWDTEPSEDGDGVVVIDAGVYNDTPGTRKQRDMAREAIDEFRRALESL